MRARLRFLTTHIFEMVRRDDKNSVSKFDGGQSRGHRGFIMPLQASMSWARHAHEQYGFTQFFGRIPMLKICSKNI